MIGNFDPTRLDLTAITVQQVATPKIVDLQRKMSKAVWRPAPGRKLGFLVKHGNDLLGIFFLASPVINLAVRDVALGLPKTPSEKGKALRSFMDVSVCVANQPFGWRWNGGKLCALLAATTGAEFSSRYGDVLTGVVTTSLYGHGAQYNRCYKFLGYTKGYGHEHVTDTVYAEMLNWMRENDVEIPSCRFGAGSNPRMRRISAYKKASGDRKLTLKHGKQRGVYWHPAIPTSDRQAVVEHWFKRWGNPRFLRMQGAVPPYQTGLE